MWSVKRSQTGLGLFATANIPADTEVIEYTGDYITEEEYEQRGGRYMMASLDGMVIDGSARSNKARYVNHSCQPNCENIVDDDGRVFITSLQDIMPGEEITVDYGDDYVEEFIKPYGCKCKSCLE